MAKTIRDQKKKYIAPDNIELIERQALERDVKAGIKRAVKEYGEVFKRLAAYDRQ